MLYYDFDRLADDLAGYVETTRSDQSDACLRTGAALVDTYLSGGGAAESCPEEVRERAYLEVASELFHRKNSPQGVAQFSTFDGSAPVRTARDPMVAAYPLLRPYVAGGFA